MSFRRIKTVKGHKYEYHVENVRVNGKVKQKIVKYFGRVDRKGIKCPICGNFFYEYNQGEL